MQSLFPTKPFKIQYKNTILDIIPLDIEGRYGFQITFSGSRKPLVVVRATAINNEKFWTSMPEGRQREAEGVGELIEQYIREHPVE